MKVAPEVYGTLLQNSAEMSESGAVSACAILQGTDCETASKVGMNAIRTIALNVEFILGVSMRAVVDRLEAGIEHGTNCQ